MGKLKRFVPSKSPSGYGVLRTGAFTLFELLVVFLIVVILVSLLLSVLNGARHKAKRVQCLSQVKQWGMAIFLHAGDHADLFPYEGHFLTSIQEGVNLTAWYNVLPKYTDGIKLPALYEQHQAPLPGTRSLFTCPSVTEGPSSPPSFTNPFFMYGFNNRMDPNGPSRFSLSQLRKPSQTVVFTENSQGRYPSTSGRHTPARHDLRANLAFGDGHAESVRTNDYHRTREQDLDSRLEWKERLKVYWYPFAGAPP